MASTGAGNSSVLRLKPGDSVTLSAGGVFTFSTAVLNKLQHRFA